MKATTKNPLVSVIVPTKNSGVFLEACLQSIMGQTYKNIETIVVDNHSTDNTQAIAAKYADVVYTLGPERSAQRNYGVNKANGEYVAIIDSDMELTEKVVEDCVEFMKSEVVSGIIIPEESFGEGFWAQCKRLEKSFYVGVDWIEAARFFRRDDYKKIGGYNEKLVSGEDWDLSNRTRKIGTIVRINSFIRHNEGKISLLKTINKKRYYASKINYYVEANTDTTSTNTEIMQVLRRFGLYLSNPAQLFKNPLTGCGMLIMKLTEYLFGFMGWASTRFLRIKTQ